MSVSSNLIEELNALVQFNVSNTQTGVKVHKTAKQDVIAAFQRLHEKGLITQEDGGYLTPLGAEAAEHAQNLLTILTSATSTTA